MVEFTYYLNNQKGNGNSEIDRFSMFTFGSFSLNSKSASTPFNRLSILLTQYGDFAKK